MDIDAFVEKAKEKGFDAVATLDIDDAHAAIAQWKTHIRDGDFVGFLSENLFDVLPNAASLLILAYPYRTYHSYPEGIGYISGYYVASNRAYHAARELADWLSSEGVLAIHTHKLPQKPLARAAGIGRYGRSGIIVRNGSHIVLNLIVTDAVVRLPALNTPVPDCERCGRCERACPTGCLKGGYVQAGRCLRAYMTHNIDNIPDDLRPLMGERLLGCDDCQSACPGLEYAPTPEEFYELFAWDALTDPDQFKANRPAIAALLGSNEADAIHEAALKRKADLSK